MNINEHEQKFIEYKKLYALQHRPPRRKAVGGGDLLVYISLFFLAISSIIVSGFHTIPTFLNTIGGDAFNELKAIATFTMIELGILIVSYIKTHDSFHSNKRESMDVGRRATFIGALILFLAVGVNLRDVLLNEDIVIHKYANIGIFALVGVAAPLVAYQASELLAYYTVRNEIEHQTAIKDWEDALNRSWSSNKRKVVKQDIPVIQEVKPSITIVRHGKARAEAERYFNENPDMLFGYTLDQIEIHAAESGYNVKRGTLYKIWRDKQ